ncbi:hypothetical protein [Spongiimicrobium salis]|uniref:hypothetical protein n=1 Tax=Spongiimicrobium salis TaxID=1667022 RepID=UPI00374DDABC
MKEQLQLTDIVGYMPYGLEVLGKKHLFKYQERPILKVNGLANNINGEWQCEYLYDGDLHFTEISDKKYQPLLYPIEYLTKEITVDDETFVPGLKLFELNNIPGMYEDLHIAETKNEGTNEKGFIVTYLDFEVFGFEYTVSDLKLQPYWIIQKLYEWHIDIGGLIPKSLALDKTQFEK